MAEPALRRLSTPRAAAFAGVVFALLFGAALILIRTTLPEGAAPGSQWLIPGDHRMRTAAVLMPFAGIAFLWFIGVLRDGFGSLEDRFFATVFLGSGVAFGQSVLLTIVKTYALRMAAVFMISLATIWLRTRLMPRALVWTTYVLALVLMVAAEVSMWLTLAFPAWVLVVSVFLLVRARVSVERSAAPRRGRA